MSISAPNCPLCSLSKTKLWSKAKDFEYFSTNEVYSYFHCEDCDCLFLHPMPKGKLALIYPKNYYSFNHLRKNIVVKIKEWLDKKYFKSLLKDIPGKELSVLDIGGGTGWLLDIIKKAEPRVKETHVIDIDSSAKKQAISCGHQYYEGTIETYPASNKFDLILLLNLIEHVANPIEVLEKAGKMLSNEGIIVIKTPNFQSWDANLFKKTYWGGLHCPRHWVIFSENSFRRIIQQTSLQIQKLTFTQGAPFWAFSIIAMLHRKKVIKISSQKPIIYHWLFPPLSGLFALVDFLRRPFFKTSQMFITLSNGNKKNLVGSKKSSMTNKKST